MVMGSSPTIGADGTVYVGTYSDMVYALDGQTGVKKWAFKVDTKYVASSPAIGDDGTVYVGGGGNRNVYALDGATGAKKWSFKTGRFVWASPSIGPDGTLYIGSTDGKLYAFKTDSSGPAKSPWPMSGQNARHTGRVLKK
jgi:outer membrane protein assembly factor BamB